MRGAAKEKPLAPRGEGVGGCLPAWGCGAGGVGVSG
jgi:hypothetical protein